MAKASMFRCRAAWLMEVAGLSMALGAFVLGRLGEIPLMISATVPEAFNDNAASGVGSNPRRRTGGGRRAGLESVGVAADDRDTLARTPRDNEYAVLSEAGREDRKR